MNRSKVTPSMVREMIAFLSDDTLREWNPDTLIIIAMRVYVGNTAKANGAQSHEAFDIASRYTKTLNT